MKLSNQVLAVILHVAVMGLSLQTFANREDFNKPSKEFAEAIATTATTLGYDLSSKDGRKQFGDYLKTQRDTLATSLGIDLSTEEGRQKYKEAVKTHVNEVAKAQNFDLTTKEGRDALEKYLVSSGDLAYVRPEPKGKHGPRDQANAQQGERKGPPPPREQTEAASQANGSTQVQRPEQRH